jgi:hypothetical protein
LVGEGECTPVFPLHSAGSIVISPAKGAKVQSFPMPPKTHLALRRYTPESLVQDSSVGRGRQFLHRLSVRLSCSSKSLRARLGSPPSLCVCSSPGEVAPDLLLSSEAAAFIRITKAPRTAHGMCCFPYVFMRISPSEMRFNAQATSKRKDNSPPATLPWNLRRQLLCSLTSPRTGFGILAEFPFPQSEFSQQSFPYWQNQLSKEVFLGG